MVIGKGKRNYIPEEMIQLAGDQMADVRLGAKTVYLMNTILLYSRELSMEFSRQKALDEFAKKEHLRLTEIEFMASPSSAPLLGAQSGPTRI